MKLTLASRFAMKNKPKNRYLPTTRAFPSLMGQATCACGASHPKAVNRSAASWGSALILAAILLGLATNSACADCNPADRIDARCYPDLQGATTAALAANEPLWLPAGTYALSRELVIDYSPLAATGFQIISDGAIIDATATGQRAMSIECSGGTPDIPKACFYFHIQGTLFVNAKTSAAAVRFGLNDLSDAHNSATIDHLIVNNAGAGLGMRLNYVLNADLSLYAVTVGNYGLYLDQVQFSRINGAASATAGTALAIVNGYTFANTFQGLDLEVAQVGLTITSPYASRNTFVSPYFNCPTPIVATAGSSNMLLNPSYGAAPPPTPGSQTGILTLP